MTDYTKLIERLREGQTHDFATGDLLDQSVVMDDAADAIHVLQAEYEGLKHVNNALKEHSLALQAKLDAMGKGAYDDTSCAGMPPNRVMERAYGLCPTDMPHLRRMAWIADYFLRNYAAPKALAPLTADQKNSAWHDHWSNPSIPSTACSAFYAGMRFAEKHHGIGGTP